MRVADSMHTLDPKLHFSEAGISKACIKFGSSQTPLFQTWLFAILRESALLRFADLLSFALIRVTLRTTAFRTIAFPKHQNLLFWDLSLFLQI